MRERVALSVPARVAVAGQCALTAGFVVVGLASAQAARGWTDLALIAIATLVLAYLAGIGVSLLVARLLRATLLQVLAVLVMPVVVLVVGVWAVRAAGN
jgi:hypothetical protein